jgi:CMP-N-acetylneuraminic acid synthetase/spore coat polysaccharide biosynthesis predicted glycosyltransferase SpsG
VTQPSARASAVPLLVVIPARGGSKGIPRKNLRSLAGHPLISYVIRTAQATAPDADILVSSDDEEILAIAAKYGVDGLRRDRDLAGDATTLDEVVGAAWAMREAARAIRYELIVTLQPTSPLLRPASLELAINRMLDDPQIDTVISATEDSHLTWRTEDGRYVPNYAARVNRQFLPKTFRETGAFIICRRRVLDAGSRIGSNVSLELLSGGEAIDIDTLEDFNNAEWHLLRRHVVFVVAGHPEIGLGHVYNALAIANSLTRHDITFVVDNRSDLAREVLSVRNFRVVQQSSASLVDDVLTLAPDVVINDRLDTGKAYVRALKDRGVTVINFEDLGEGARYADLVVNAIYPERHLLPNHYYGQRYFCIRDEFQVTPPTQIKPVVGRVLLSFGGTDPNDLTSTVVEEIAQFCCDRGIAIDVVLGMGYAGAHGDPHLEHVRVHRNVGNISDYMSAADLIFTSAGRTVFEVASLGVPAIVIAQNERETTHFFASEEHGFLNLGLAGDLKPGQVLAAFSELVDNHEARQHMHRLMLDNELKTGKGRVLRLIERTIEGT